MRVTPSFQLTGRFGLDMVNLREEQFESRKVSGTYASSADGVAKSGYTDANRYLFESFATFLPNLGTRHELEVTAGGSLELNRGELNFVRGEGFSSDDFQEVRNATIITEFDGTQSENNLVSFFTRADYTLGGKYTFGGSLRTVQLIANVVGEARALEQEFAEPVDTPALEQVRILRVELLDLLLVGGVAAAWRSM